MQYRASFALQLTGMFAVCVLELIAVVILFDTFPTLGGWTLGEIAMLYGLSSFSFGIAHTLAGGFTTFSDLVRRGDFDRVLVRPVGSLVQTLAAEFQLHRLGWALQGALTLVIAFRLLALDWTPGKVIYLPVVVLSAVVLFVALFSLEATLCFWTTEGTEVVNAFTYGGSHLAQYPLHIYDAWLRRLFLFVIPLGFVVYTPSLYLLDKPDPLGLPTWTRFVALPAAVVFAVIAGALWRVGVRHYRSTGS
jgi:ABC-2 type transport system permease protein